MCACECWNQDGAGIAQAGSEGELLTMLLPPMAAAGKASRDIPAPHGAGEARQAALGGRTHNLPAPPCSHRAAAGDGHILIRKYLMFLRKHF